MRKTGCVSILIVQIYADDLSRNLSGNMTANALDTLLVRQLRTEFVSNVDAPDKSTKFFYMLLIAIAFNF